MPFRRRIAAALVGASLALGAGAATQHASAASLLCPPGCVLAGALSGIGGFPDPSTFSVYGTITVVTNRTAVGVLSPVAQTTSYYVSLTAGVSISAAGTVSGSGTLHIDNGDFYNYDTINREVTVTGTRNAVVLSGVGGSNLNANLAVNGTAITGTFLAVG